jgi:hypothetical protein
MLTPLTKEHLDLADKVRYDADQRNRSPEDRWTIGKFLADQFTAEDKDFDRANWLKACGV